MALIHHFKDYNIKSYILLADYNMIGFYAGVRQPSNNTSTTDPSGLASKSIIPLWTVYHSVPLLQIRNKVNPSRNQIPLGR